MSISPNSQTPIKHTNSNWYDDPAHNYQDYWKGRDYEDAAERMAIKRLLKGRHFRHAVDIGGGYGRLCVFWKSMPTKSP